jgi:hypothetical protein
VKKTLKLINVCQAVADGLKYMIHSMMNIHPNINLVIQIATSKHYLPPKINALFAERFLLTKMAETLYYEVHITIEPVFDEQLEQVRKLGQSMNFKVADLLMKKRKDDTETRSQYDTFMTAHCKTMNDAIISIVNVCNELKLQGFKVWRYKIEDVIIDSRNQDVLRILPCIN